MSGIDYSKWNNIEISDDEDETHPNIDTGSLYRWRHQARLDRMAEAKKEKQDVEKNLKTAEKKKHEIQTKLTEAEKKNKGDAEKLRQQMKKLEEQEAEFKRKEEEIKQKEKLTPLNIDTICHDAKSRSVINKEKKPEKKQLTEEEQMEEQRIFFDKYEKEMKKYGLFQKYDDAQQYLEDHPHLVSEYTANYLVVWCVNLEVKDKHELMKHVAHQCIVMQFILELAKTKELHPSACVRAFFNRMKHAENETDYMRAFLEELNLLIARIEKRAKERIQEAVDEMEKEEREKRLGPGGLDPVEVFASLPPGLQECFDTKDIPRLQEEMAKLPVEEARYHLKRCIDSGMWVPNAKDGVAGEGEEDEDEDEHYENIDGEPQTDESAPSTSGSDKLTATQAKDKEQSAEEQDKEQSLEGQEESSSAKTNTGGSSEGGNTL